MPTGCVSHRASTHHRSAAPTSAVISAHPWKLESRKSISYVAKRPLVIALPWSKSSAKKGYESFGVTSLVRSKTVESTIRYLLWYSTLQNGVYLPRQKKGEAEFEGARVRVVCHRVTL